MISNASFPVEQSNTEQDVSVLPLIEELIDDNLFDPEPHNSVIILLILVCYFGVFWYFVAMIGAQLRYVLSEA